MYEPEENRWAAFGYKGYHDGARWWINGQPYEPYEPPTTDTSSDNTPGGGILVAAAIAVAAYSFYRAGRWIWRKIVTA